MKIKMDEEKDEVLLTINFDDYTMSLAPPCSLLSSSTPGTMPGSPATPASAIYVDLNGSFYEVPRLDVEQNFRLAQSVDVI
jgi:hypothetical protein